MQIKLQMQQTGVAWGREVGCTVYWYLLWNNRLSWQWWWSFFTLKVFLLLFNPQHLSLWPLKGLSKWRWRRGEPAASYYRTRQLTNVAAFTHELLLISQTMLGLMGRGLRRGHGRFLLFLQDTAETNVLLQSDYSSHPPRSPSPQLPDYFLTAAMTPHLRVVSLAAVNSHLWLSIFCHPPPTRSFPSSV